MPHLIFEYTNNIKDEAAIPELLKRVNESLLQHDDIIPIGGLRSRAFGVEDYCIADGKEDDAFVHACLKIATGRTEEQIKQVTEDLFETIKAHFAPLYEKRYLALSLEIHEFQRPALKHNNIHTRFRK